MNKQKRLTLVLMVVILLVSMVSVTTAQDDVFRVAVVAPSTINDLAFSQSMYDALLAVQEEMGEEAFQFDFQDGTFVVDDAAVAMREWAASGEYDLVIGHGSQYGAIVEELAPEFPDVSFAWGTDVNTFGLDNVFAYTAAAEEGGYVNGVLAASFTQSKNIGVIGPIEVGDAKAYVDGFKAGVAATDPAVEVNVNYIQSFSDVPLATEAANTFIANGADVLTGSAQMVVGPIAVAKEAGVLWFGTQSSQAELSEKSGVTFQVYHWEVVLNDIIASIGEGVLGGEAYVATLENGGLVIEINEAGYEGTAEELETFKASVQAIIDPIIAGEVQILPEASEEATPEATPEA
jgi:basic membrane lipoprotein Med (substrate-binding protein (PBP1-ABC) superfamily)